MRLQPINDRLLVEPIFGNDVSDGGIYIPPSAKETPMRGRVAFVGEGGYLESGQFRKTQLKVGDEVLYGRYAGSEINIDGKGYLILVEADIFGIMVPD